MNTHNGLRTEAQGKPNIVTDGVGEVCRHGHVMGGDDASRFLPSLIYPSNLPQCLLMGSPAGLGALFVLV